MVKKERKIVTLLLRTTKAREFPYVILRPFRFITYRPFIIPRYPQWTKLAGRRTSENTQASGPQVEQIKGIRTRRRFALPECFCSSLQLQGGAEHAGSENALGDKQTNLSDRFQTTGRHVLVSCRATEVETTGRQQRKCERLTIACWSRRAQPWNGDRLIALVKQTQRDNTGRHLFIYLFIVCQKSSM